MIDSSSLAAADADGSGSHDRQIDLEDVAKYGQTYKIVGGWGGGNNPFGEPIVWAGMGSSVATGDVLGDSREDILVGAGESSMQGPFSGAVWLAAPGAIEDHSTTAPDGQKIVNLNDDWVGGTNQNWYTISGEKGYDELASGPNSLDAGADLDGDGRADMLMGARFYDWKPGRTLHVPADADLENVGAAYLVASSELSIIDGNDDHYIKLQDVVDRNQPGDPYPSLNTRYSYKFLGEEAHDQAGMAVKMLGDVTGDGVADLLIGAPRGNTEPGKAYLISGGALEDLDSLDSIDQLIYLGNVAGVGGSYKFVGTSIDVFGDGSVITGDGAGSSFADLGDMDGDGRTDFAIGTSTGKSYVIGSTDLYNLDAVDGAVDGVIHLENVPYEPELVTYDAIRTSIPISGLQAQSPLRVADGELESVVEPITFQLATHGKLSEGDIATIDGVDYVVYNVADGKGTAILDTPGPGTTPKGMNFTALRMNPVVSGTGPSLTLIIPDDPDGDFERINAIQVNSINAAPSNTAAALVDGDNLVTLVCFAAGTRIITRHGEVTVERLQPGDEVLTLDNGFKPLRWVGSTRLRTCERTAPIRIRAGVFGNSEDLFVSPQHRMLIRSPLAELLFGEHEVLVAARHLVDGERVDRVSGGVVSYYHLLFDQHEIIFANGAPTESLYPAPDVVAELPEPMRQALYERLPALRDGRTPGGFESLARVALRGREARILWREMARGREHQPQRQVAPASYALAR
ncbi:FG-GAP repeat-containing protein [Meinhardsimonia xiamenensis]|uniref:FG-GAP repeat-containing protein n=1 Tax=Meinhardsimonia xiamenensis TaxID=990712 RepID=A0A1G9DY16_9RHOB|nr:Hint domain-containing protein [Meinhardsimonia xiamenensis]PRX31148.1 FG-GAP repeat protein [Meinhardsimonia xiamenensis]SDK68782.1 FG-GAP repeat-containing protein [Meinhardsimonia xiamenensis]